MDGFTFIRESEWIKTHIKPNADMRVDGDSHEAQDMAETHDPRLEHQTPFSILKEDTMNNLRVTGAALKEDASSFAQQIRKQPMSEELLHRMHNEGLVSTSQP
jgi:hypothetical protein